MTTRRSPRPRWVCTACTAPLARWPGARCPKCAGFATAIIGIDDAIARGVPLPFALLAATRSKGPPQRLRTGLAALDRVLSTEGGAVPGDSILLAAVPGAGKTTMLMQACAHVARRRRALYITIEQDVPSLAALAERLGASKVIPIASRSLGEVEGHVRSVRPALAIVDSVTELAKCERTTVAAVVSRLHALAHEAGATLVLTSHVNSSGLVRGGPEVSHGTDAVLLMLGEPRKTRRRTLVQEKNRANDTTIGGEMEMTDRGLVAVTATPPSAPRALGPGRALGLVHDGEGARVVEVEAARTPRDGSGERRMVAVGFPAERLRSIAATAERDGVDLGGDHVTVRLAAGAKTSDVAIDAAVYGAITSAARGVALPAGVVLAGEVGLGGDLRVPPWAGEAAREVGLRLLTADRVAVAVAVEHSQLARVV